MDKTRHGRLANALTRKPVGGMDGNLDIDVPEDSSSFSKHSRDHYRLSRILTGFRTDTAYAPQISIDNRKFLKELVDGDFRGDSECRSLYEDRLGREGVRRMWQVLHVDDLAEKILDLEDISDLQYLCLLGALSDVRSKDNPLYACYRPVQDERDGTFLNGDLSRLITVACESGLSGTGRLHPQYMDWNVSLNWIDMSGMTNLHGLFNGSPFNGDISLWDVSHVEFMTQMFADSEFNGDISKWDVRNVQSMHYMFFNSRFRGNIRDWEVSPTCRTAWMFRDCNIPEENKPLRLRKVDEGVTAVLTKKSLDFDAPDIDVLPPEDSSSFSKHSRDFHRMDGILGHLSFVSPLKNQMSADDRKFLRGLVISDFNGDMDMESRFKETIPAGKRNVFIAFLMAGDVLNKICERIPFDGNDRVAAEELQKVHSKEHPLYGCLDISKLHEDPALNMMLFMDIFTVGAEDGYLGPKANLNWLDMSGMDSLNSILRNNKVFNGDISLWDISNVKDARRMFKNSVFDGDISGWDVRNMMYMNEMFHDSAFTGDIRDWQVSDDARIYTIDSEPGMWIDDNYRKAVEIWYDLFHGCAIPDENKPICLRDKLLDDQDEEYEDVYEAMTANALTRKPLDFDSHGGNPLEVVPPQDSSSFSKHTRGWYDIQPFLDRKYPLNDLRKLDSEIDPADRQLLADIYSGEYDSDKEAWELIRKHSLREIAYPLTQIYPVMRECIAKIHDDQKMTKTQITFMREHVATIQDKDDYLYAYYVPSGLNDLKGIIANFSRSCDGQCFVNLNWIDVSGMTSLKGAFNFADVGKDFDIPHYDISLWDVSGVRNMRSMFASSDFNGDISGWDVSKVEDMSYMFQNSQFNGDISGWNVGNVRTMQGMFKDSWFNQDISDWKDRLGNVRDMVLMFSNSEFNKDIPGWKLPELTTAVRMFYESKKFNGSVEGWEFPKLRYAAYMFAGKTEMKIDSEFVNSRPRKVAVPTRFCQDLSSWDVSGITDMNHMFEHSLFDRDISDWKIRKGCNTEMMFHDCRIREEYMPVGVRDMNEGMSAALTRKPLDFDSHGGNPLEVVPPQDSSSFSKHSRDWYVLTDISKQAETGVRPRDIYRGMDEDARLLFRDVCEDMDSHGPEVREMFSEGTALARVLPLFGDTYPTLFPKMDRWIEKVMSVELFDDDEIDFKYDYIQKITDRDNPLYAYWRMKDVDDEDFRRMIRRIQGTSDRPGDMNLNWIDLTGIISTEKMFFDSPFNGDISLWDVSEVKNMRGMFNRSSFNGDISGWDVSNVEDMSWMFASSEFNGDISAWKDRLCSVTNMSNMFYGSKFNRDIPGWDMPNLKRADYMFDASDFNGSVEGWRFPKLETMERMFSTMSVIYNPKTRQSKRVKNPFNRDLSSWDVSGVNNMDGMFINSVFDRDISGWEINDRCTVKDMFVGCRIGKRHMPKRLR